jgi:Ca-activated chloride channel family protein
MSFGQPLWLWLLLALPAIALAEAWVTRRDRARTARFVARPLWPKVVRAPARPWRFVRLALVLVGAAGFVLALARPQWGIVREKVEREGVDVVLVLDTSGSMSTADVPPNRFYLAKTALLNLVSRLDGDRFALVAFEGDAYPLVPLTLDADAIGLFLDTLEPGAVPSPGSSLGAGLAKGLAAFVDEGRRNKAMVLVSDGEDLEGEVEGAVEKARKAGVVVHTVGVGTLQGQPVPDFDENGRLRGYKKADDGSPVVSRLHPETLEAIARGTGGRSMVVTPTDPSLSPIAAAIEGMERKTLAREYSYRKKDRFQLPLAVGLVAFTLGLLLPPPGFRGSAAVARRAASLTTLLLLGAGVAQAETSHHVTDELLLRPSRLTASGRKAYADGNHPKALESFRRAAEARPGDARARFNLADALYKNGKLDEARTLYEPLAADPASPLAAPARFNLGNTLYQKKDYPGAVRAYRDALRLVPGDADARRNLELALRALKEQEEQKQRQQQGQQKQDQEKTGAGQSQQQKASSQTPPKAGQPQQRPKSEAEKERERFEKEAGMPKERAMQILDALQQNEKAEQRRLQAERRKTAKGGKDW